MPAVRLILGADGKVIVVDGKATTNETCCCGVSCTAENGTYPVELVGCQDGLGGTYDTTGSITIAGCAGSGGPACAAGCGGVSFDGLLAMDSDGQWTYVISGAGGEFAARYTGPSGGGSPVGSYSFSEGSEGCGWPSTVNIGEP